MKQNYLLRYSWIIAMLIFLSANSIAQVLNGVVKDADDQSPLIGANIRISGTNMGTVTDLDGNFSINVNPGDILIISYIGYEEQRITYQNQTNLEILLKFAVTEMSEVIVIGYGVQEKKVATGSVSSVNSDVIENYRVASVESAMDGMISGVQINESSGQPGEDMNIFIRGIGTNGDNTPLYIVDGMTVHSISYLNPSDIESINVLKDAASTAIYGARGANGVVIVTTKSGSGEAKGTISYEYFMSQSNPWKMPEMLNGEQYVEITREKFANADRLDILEFDENKLDDDFPLSGAGLPSVNWMDEIFNPANTVRHSLAATLKSSYFSMDYWDEYGVIGGDKSRYKRISMRANSTKDIGDWVTVKENLTFIHTENPRIGTNDLFTSVLADAFAYDPIAGLFKAGTDFGYSQSKFVKKEHINPLNRLAIQNNYGIGQRLMGNAGIEIKPMEGLSFNSVLGVDFDWSRYRSFTPQYDIHPEAQNPNNSVTQGYDNWLTTQFENFVKYEKNMNGHNLNVMVGSTYKDTYHEYAGGRTLTIPLEVQNDPNWQYITAGQDTSSIAWGGAGVRQRLLSYFGRVIYNFQGKYLFTASLRRDGSSKFGQNNRFGYFPSVSAGWIISDESFFPIPQVSYFKIRGSWGVNGNDRIPDLRYAGRIETAFTYPLGGGYNTEELLNTGTALATPPNPNIKWEESEQINIGFDLNLFADQITTEFDFYIKNTRDLLMSEKLLGYIGATNDPISNLGSIRNKGIEFAIKYNGSVSDFKYVAGLNYTYLENEVTEVAGETNFIPGWGWPVKSVTVTRMEEGYPIGVFMGYVADGVFASQDEVYRHFNAEGELLQPNAEAGDLRFVDVNEDGKIDPSDITYLGSPWPTHFIGANLAANYKGFEFSAVLASQLGQKIYRTYERPDISLSNYQAFWYDRWTPENPDSDIPRLVYGDPNNNQRPSTFYLEDGDFLRLRNLQLAYNVQPELLEKAKLSGLKIYVTGNNLLTLTKYRGFDPEVGTNGWILDTGIDKGYYPVNKSMGIGVKITL